MVPSWLSVLNFKQHHVELGPKRLVVDSSRSVVGFNCGLGIVINVRACNIKRKE